MTKKEWLKIIYDRQQMYVKRLADTLESDGIKKTINFNSPTGTGKTFMLASLINLLGDATFYFLITTLSRGGLNNQISTVLKRLITTDNYFVYGVSSFTASTKLQANEILKKIPKDKKLIWIRDEGHIKSNNWSRILENLTFKIVNLSATNNQIDIQCNFVDTPLLRTPIQLTGTPRDAVERLSEVKKVHKNVPDYNPCLIVRDVNEQVTEEFFSLAKDFGFKIINVTDSDANIQDLCDDDNPFDIIVNKMKITEGIDIPRASVLYIGNRPNNEATTIQLIGRVRRNALLWKNEIDIFAPENQFLLRETIKAYIYFRIDGSEVASDQNDELIMEMSNLISFEQLTPDRIEVRNNELENGLTIAELSLMEDETYSGVIRLSHSGPFVTATNLPILYSKKEKEIKLFGYTYMEVVKDRELVEISFDKVKYLRTTGGGVWRTATTVTDNIQYGKLNKFIRLRYYEELATWKANEAKQSHLDNAVDFENDKRINRCLGYFCEYYLKYLLFGEECLAPFLDEAKSKIAKIDQQSKIDAVLYAICLCYKKEMALFYGEIIERIVPTLSLNEIFSMPQTIKDWVVAVVQRATLKIPALVGRNINSSELKCPHLGNPSILHGVVDLALEDTLIQFSCKGNIKEGDILKLLAYHYLSTKRHDLKITKVIFFDFSSGDSATIEISPNNLTKLAYIPSKRLEANYFENKAKKEFTPNQISQYYSKFGAEFLNSILHENSLALSKKTSWKIKDPKTGKVVLIHQSDILKAASRISDETVNETLLENLAPTKETLSFAIKYGNVAYVKKTLKEIKPSSSNLTDAVETGSTEIVRLILNSGRKPSIMDFEKAVLSGDENMVDLVLGELNITKRTANDVIRAKNEKAITKMLAKIKPSPYNLIVAIKTKDLNTIALVGSRYGKIPKACLEEAQKAGLPDITDWIKKAKF